MQTLIAVVHRTLGNLHARPSRSWQVVHCQRNGRLYHANPSSRYYTTIHLWLPRYSAKSAQNQSTGATCSHRNRAHHQSNIAGYGQGAALAAALHKSYFMFTSMMVSVFQELRVYSHTSLQLCAPTHILLYAGCLAQLEHRSYTNRSCWISTTAPPFALERHVPLLS